jgi:WS/DGAT/MGAT family acyltransferase
MGQRLSNTESFMWSLGQDPNLASTMGLVSILESAPERQRLHNTITNLVAKVERLRLKVNDPLGVTGPLSQLEWVVDTQFDLDHHLRMVNIDGSDGSDDGVAPEPTGPELRRLATQFVNDPFDRTRPLWQFLVVTGLAEGKAALLSKFHHSISDGAGLVRLALHLLEFEQLEHGPEAIDLDDLFQAEDDEVGDGFDDRLRSGAERILDVLREMPSPNKLWEIGEGALASAKAAGVQLSGEPKSSTLWSRRSRNRRFEMLDESLESIKDRARELEVSVNDLFVAACAQAAVHYHEEYDIDLERVLATVVINVQPERTNDPAELGQDDNTFLPVSIEIPGAGVDAEERLAVIRSEVKTKRTMLEGRTDALDALSSLGNFMPPPMAAAITLGQASRVDFATSNVAGVPIPTWFAGRRVEAMYPMGPVTGTAFNITMNTYDQRAFFGIHIDPAAVHDPHLLAKSIGLSFRELGVERS